jgi:hypothetical protein
MTAYIVRIHRCFEMQAASFRLPMAASSPKEEAAVRQAEIRLMGRLQFLEELEYYRSRAGTAAAPWRTSTVHTAPANIRRLTSAGACTSSIPHVYVCYGCLSVLLMVKAPA